MSVSNEGSNSEISQSNTNNAQTRYKKAVKQINKMVIMNNSLTKELQVLKESYRKLEKDFSKLSSQYEEVTTKYNKLSKSSPVYRLNKAQNSGGKISFQAQSEYADDLDDQHMDSSNLQVNSSHVLENTQIQTDFINNQKIQQLQEKCKELNKKIQEQDNIINDLKITNEKINFRNVELERKILDLTEELTKAKSMMMETESSMALAMSQELMNERKKVEELENKLVRAEDWARQLTKDYESLKKSQVFGDQEKLINITGLTSYARNNSNKVLSKLPSNNNNNNTLSQNQLFKLKKQFQQSKTKYKQQIKRQNEEIRQLQEKIQTLNSFVIKQQSYIKQMTQAQQKKVSN